jgi:hypothetical protein
LEPSELGVGASSGKWGSAIPEGGEKLTLLKLSLLHPVDLPRCSEHPEHLAEVEKAVSKVNNDCKDAVAKYIKHLWADSSASLRKSLEKKGLDLNDLDIQFMFTIPAVWHEDALARMKSAVESSDVLSFAGKSASVEYIPEPEAAARAVIPDLLKKHPLEVRRCSSSLALLISVLLPCCSELLSLTWSRRRALSVVLETNTSTRLTTPL